VAMRTIRHVVREIMGLLTRQRVAIHGRANGTAMSRTHAVPSRTAAPSRARRSLSPNRLTKVAELKTLLSLEWRFSLAVFLLASRGQRLGTALFRCRRRRCTRLEGHCIDWPGRFAAQLVQQMLAREMRPGSRKSSDVYWCSSGDGRAWPRNVRWRRASRRTAAGADGGRS
jgi:hypothetical protein